MKKPTTNGGLRVLLSYTRGRIEGFGYQVLTDDGLDWQRDDYSDAAFVTVKDPLTKQYYRFAVDALLGHVDAKAAVLAVDRDIDVMDRHFRAIRVEQAKNSDFVEMRMRTYANVIRGLSGRVVIGDPEKEKPEPTINEFGEISP